MPAAVYWLSDGSAPRVRGTGPEPCCFTPSTRFSPACAGNGESGWLGCAHLTGSAPRVRGTASVQRRKRRFQRFSPACAGNGFFSPFSSCSMPVQPRVCGERVLSWVTWQFGIGSAPRVRGTGCVVSSLVRTRPVQPRVCGERDEVGCGHGGFSGSAPRVRGTELAARNSGGGRRFSPACAGNGSATNGANGVVQRFSPACAGNGTSPWRHCGYFMRASRDGKEGGVEITGCSRRQRD